MVKIDLFNIDPNDKPIDRSPFAELATRVRFRLPDADDIAAQSRIIVVDWGIPTLPAALGGEEADFAKDDKETR